jgi:hypothetical protein
MLLYHLLDLNRHFAETAPQHILLLLPPSEYALLPYLIACLHLLLPISLYALRLLGPPELVRGIIVIFDHLEGEVLRSLRFLLLLAGEVSLTSVALPQELVPRVVVPVLGLELEEFLQAGQVLLRFKAIGVRVLQLVEGVRSDLVLVLGKLLLGR